MSCGLAPSKTTVYCSNLPFSLTNNDLHRIFEKYGKAVKVTVMKDRETRQSKGVAFVLFLDRQEAHAAVSAMHNKELFGRTLKCSIAKDNGRTPEFIRRKTYTDKSRCYECGEPGHLSYQCPKNAFGDRELPEKKLKKRRKSQQPRPGKAARRDDNEEEEDIDEDEDLSLGAAIRESWEHEQHSTQAAGGKTSKSGDRKALQRGYFSDEDASD